MLRADGRDRSYTFLPAALAGQQSARTGQQHPDNGAALAGHSSGAAIADALDDRLLKTAGADTI
jgi:hypothetical protein